MNHRNISTDILSRRVENLVDRYEMRRTGKSLFAVRQEFIVGAGEVVTDEQKKEMYLKYGGDGTNNIDLPLFLD
tara:strand:- start:171 stop:392 length:222 start_codon:yes stop_codon:yes gene_type:complete